MINRSPSYEPASGRRRSHAVPIRPRALIRLLASAARRVREQAANEDRARLIAHFAAVEHARPDAALELMWRRPARTPLIARVDDPLERLRNLPARGPRGAR